MREVTLLGTADLSFWKDWLMEQDLPSAPGVAINAAIEVTLPLTTSFVLPTVTLASSRRSSSGSKRSRSLQPGWYSLEIGSWQFGASGWGVLTKNNVDIGRPSYYRRLQNQYYDGVTDVRLFVEAVPEPPAILLLLACLATFPFLRRRAVFK